MKTKLLSLFVAVILFICPLLFTSCTIVVSGSEVDSSGSSGTSSGFSGLDLGIAAIDKCLKDHAYYDYDTDEMKVAAIKAYVQAMGDDYAEFYTVSEYLELIAEGNGELTGIGVQVVANTVEISGTVYQVYQIVNVYQDSPALEAGLQPGDLIYAVMVDGDLQTITSMGYDRALNNMRGEEGTSATVAVFRRENDSYIPLTFSEIVRKKITTYSVTYEISETDPTVGIVKISSFDNTTADQLMEAIDALLADGIQKFVLDLRNNPGGYLTSVCRVLSFFLQENDLMLSSVNKNDKVVEEYRVVAGASLGIQKSDIGKYRGLNLVVLVNGNTASAAEVFTSNIKHYQIGKVVGTLTFGKGIMQTTYSLVQYGYPGFLKVTSYAYTDPSGWCYHKIGISPDVEQELSEEAKNTNLYLLEEVDDAQLLKAISMLGQ